MLRFHQAPISRRRDFQYVAKDENGYPPFASDLDPTLKRGTTMKRSIPWMLTIALIACSPVDHREHYAAVDPSVVEMEAGSVRSDSEARTICPSVCGARGWAGRWRRVGDEHHAVCGCSSNAPAAPISQEQPTSCNVQGNDACGGCSITCPAGQQAQCAEGVAQQRADASLVCVSPARCLCQ